MILNIDIREDGTLISNIDIRLVGTLIPNTDIRGAGTLIPTQTSQGLEHKIIDLNKKYPKFTADEYSLSVCSISIKHNSSNHM